MELTIFGLIIAAVCSVLLLRAGSFAILSVVMVCSAFGGGAALILPALGGSSVPPSSFALLFLLARIVLPGDQVRGIWDSLRANMFIGLYAAYGVVMAMFGPRLFAGQIEVVAMRPGKLRTLFSTVPLQFTPQNITASVYLIGTFLAGAAAYVAMRDRDAPLRFVRTGVLIAWMHIFFGVSGAVFRGTPYDMFINFFRNATYSQTEQTFATMVRIYGVFSEPSAFASFGFAWFAFLFECWLRDVLPRRTGPAAAAMAAVLVFSTSSTAYVALGLYGAILLVRVVMFPASLPIRKGILIGAAILLVCIGITGVLVLFPRFASDFGGIIEYTTVGKQNSSSGQQRAFWAKVGWDSFLTSWGMGIGPGSFRSSSIVTGILGSVGVLGAILFVMHFIRVMKPLRISTYFGSRRNHPLNIATLVGASAGWAAFSVLIPAALISPSCDPGSDFAIFGGVALALRAIRPGAGRRVIHKLKSDTPSSIPLALERS